MTVNLQNGTPYPSDKYVQVIFDPLARIDKGVVYPSCDQSPVIVPADKQGIVWIMGKLDGSGELYTVSEFKFLGVCIDSEIESFGVGFNVNAKNKKVTKEWSYPAFGSPLLLAKKDGPYEAVSTMAVWDRHRDPQPAPDSDPTNLHGYTILYLDVNGRHVQAYDPRIQNQ